MDPNLFDYSTIIYDNTPVGVCSLLSFYFPNVIYEVDYDFNITRFEDLTPSNRQQPTKDEIDTCLDTINRNFPMYKLRQYRDKILSETDKYMLSDYPITQQQRDEIVSYRQQLRDLPEIVKSQNVEIDITNLSEYFPSKPF